jgi:hypothetical protein
MRVNSAMTPKRILLDEWLPRAVERCNSSACSVVETLAGDCSRSMVERLREVEASCQFGQRCTRGCAHAQLPGHAVVAPGRVEAGSVGNIEAAANGLEY